MIDDLKKQKGVYISDDEIDRMITEATNKIKGQTAGFAIGALPALATNTIFLGGNSVLMSPIAGAIGASAGYLIGKNKDRKELIKNLNNGNLSKENIKKNVGLYR